MTALTFGTNPSDELQKQFATLLLKQGMDSSPVQHWTQGAARMANALVGGLTMKDISDKANAEDSVIAKVLMGQQPGGQPAAMQPLAPQATPQTSAPASGATESLWSSPGANGWNVQNVNGQRVAVNNTPDTGATSSIPSPLDPPKLDSKAMHLAAALVQSEAGNQGPQGQQAVANTLRNRAADSGMTIPQIVGQKGQFEPVGTGRINQFGPGTPGYDSAVAATERAYTGNDPTRGAVNFYAPQAQAQANDGRPAVAKFDNGNGINIQDQRYFTRAGNAAPATDFTAQSRQPQSAPTLRSTSAVPAEVQTQINDLIANGGSRGKALAMQLWSKYQAPTNPTDDMREYAAAQQQGFKGTLFDFITAKKQAGAIQNQVMIDQKGESEFSKQAGGLQAKRFDELVADAPTAKQMVSDVEMLRDLGGKIQTGKMAEVKAAIGPYAQALGIDVKNLGEMQAYEAMVNRVAPNLRVKGAGAQSDFELRNFLKSIPSLGNTPEGNEIVARTLQGLQQNKIKAAEIASRALSGEISRPEAERLIRELPDPMQGWRNMNKASGTGNLQQRSLDDLLKQYGR